MADSYISEAVIRRLPRYYRMLCSLDADGFERVSSAELSEMMDLNASQIRRDFNCFGEFGQQGYGYQVSKLKSEIRAILGLQDVHHLVIAGLGNMGHALMNYSGFAGEKFLIDAGFDANPELIGESINGVPVMDIDSLVDFATANPIDIGVICTPSHSAQSVCDLFARAGIMGVWNFAPCELNASPGMYIENVHLSDSLHILSYRLHADY